MLSASVNTGGPSQHNDLRSHSLPALFLWMGCMSFGHYCREIDTLQHTLQHNTPVCWDNPKLKSCALELTAIKSSVTGKAGKVWQEAVYVTEMIYKCIWQQ